MKTISISAEERKQTGRSGANAARREGKIPGVLYGQGKSIVLAVNRKDFLKAMHEAHGENVLFDVSVGTQAPLKSILREVQHDELHRHITHVDFQHIDLRKKIHVKVAVHLHGEPEGVKTYGGILEHTSREVEILCLPAEIPPHFDVDVSKLLVGDSIHVSDLPSGNWEFLTEAVRVVAQVTAPTVEKIETTEASATADAAAATPSEEGKSEGAAGKGDAKGAPAKGDAKPAKGSGGKS